MNGVQINDSFIIVKQLNKILYGAELTEEEVEFEYQMTFGLMLALEAQMFENGKSFSICIGKMTNGTC